MTADQAKNVPLQPDWVDYFRNSIRVVEDKGLLLMPLRGVAFRIDKTNKKLVIIVEHGEYAGEMDDILSTRIMAIFGYEVVRQAGSIIEDPEELARKLSDLAAESTNIYCAPGFLEKLESFVRRQKR
jgi:hypothetical protein